MLDLIGIFCYPGSLTSLWSFVGWFYGAIGREHCPARRQGGKCTHGFRIQESPIMRRHRFSGVHRAINMLQSTYRPQAEACHRRRR